ncbi:MAG TPA: hypothetical protein VGO77_21095 [Mycobacterium sp.]|jgi:hypothetical protein|uniref:hypothetical protein n=1 Tax=Mycobacterium sp. TaxID=1785 RepID=UPI0028BC90C9|nr:hypothetical protein [Mycobacterium sp.]MDT5116412.1 hypothetical protein [Mycobacterium sp.]HEV7582860.1 hypothetical protein [Mycobacterium sp.]
MLIIALVLALIGLVALVFAVVTSNELVAWVCIGASVLGVVLLIVDALQERQRRDEDHSEPPAENDAEAVDYPEEVPDESAEDATAVEKSADDETAKDSTVTAETGRDDSAK